MADNSLLSLWNLLVGSGLNQQYDPMGNVVPGNNSALGQSALAGRLAAANAPPQIPIPTTDPMGNPTGAAPVVAAPPANPYAMPQGYKPPPVPVTSAPGMPITRKPRYTSIPIPVPRSDTNAPQPMSFWQRNAALMKDPTTGEYIDPSAAQRALG
jgi:hypothetical protein